MKNPLTVIFAGSALFFVCATAAAQCQPTHVVIYNPNPRYPTTLTFTISGKNIEVVQTSHDNYVQVQKYKDINELMEYLTDRVRYEPAFYSNAFEWAKCHTQSISAGAGKGTGTLTSGGDKPSTDRTNPSSDRAGVDVVTPAVPGCPKYVSKLNIEWQRKPGSNPQLNIWEAKNVTKGFTFRVTYRANGVNTDLPTLNPGDAAEVWGLNNEPPYVVRNFYDMKNWERTNSQQKSLECSLAIRPQ